jgi:hypothetical protein
VPSLNHGPRCAVGSRARRLGVAVAICAIASLAIAGSAAAAGNATVTTTVSHFSKATHFDPCLGFAGTTEYATGTEHLHVVELADGTRHVSYGETFWITEVSDDPTIPSRERQGTDALTFHLINNGPEIFHESFHDKNTFFGDIFFFTTFVAVDGKVRVDHTFVRNPPSDC